MTFDLVLVGGGLQSALVALAVLERDRRARLAIVERGAALCGNHTWSFHAGDLSPAMARLVAPAVAHRWPAYDVAFPGFMRRIHRSYASIPSERLADVLAARLSRAPDAALRLAAEATSVGARTVSLASGERLAGRCVVDARGPDAARFPVAGFQKFLGLELRLARPLPLEVPLVMDARVPQDDGFRFVYALPLAPDRALVEDTYFSDGAELDERRAEAAILAWVEARGGVAGEVVRRERGVLPLPLAPAIPPELGGALAGGYRGAWFHPTTGYSLPAAARLAELLAASFPSAPGADALARLAAAHGRQVRFFTLLNRLLFGAVPAAERWRVLERFHRLPEDTIERFYALRTTAADRARILVGRPPPGISLTRALRALHPGGVS